MEQLTPTARWTVTHPWRGLFGLVVTLGFAFALTTTFDLDKYMGLVTLYLMSLVPIEVVISLAWGGKYPPTEGLHQPWRGFLLTGLMIVFGTLAYLILRNFMSAGVAQPFVNSYSIIVVIYCFFAFIAFGAWPFHKMSPAPRGLITMIAVYLVILALFSMLVDFSMLSYPTGVNPSPIGAVPFYAKGGPLAAYADMAPHGPFAWESVSAFTIWMPLFLFVFVTLGMWPFSKSQKLMKQPVMGIILTLTCGVLSLIANIIAVGALRIEPLKFMLIAVCYLFGILMFLVLLETWPGRTLKQPAGGFVNLLLSIGVGVVGYYVVLGFCTWHFGKALVYPFTWFAMANVMLGITFPAWVAYTAFFEYWPLPPPPAPKAE